jgi:hypothetical protein
VHVSRLGTVTMRDITLLTCDGTLSFAYVRLPREVQPVTFSKTMANYNSILPKEYGSRHRVLLPDNLCTEKVCCVSVGGTPGLFIRCMPLWTMGAVSMW